MWKSLIYFLWEWAVGKDIKLSEALKNHKFRVLLFVLTIISMVINYALFIRLSDYHNAFEELRVKYTRQRTENTQLREQNKILIDKITTITK